MSNPEWRPISIDQPPMANARVRCGDIEGLFQRIRRKGGVPYVFFSSVPKTRHLNEKLQQYVMPLEDCEYVPGILDAITAAGSLHAYLTGQQRQASAITPQYGAWVTQGKPEWWQSFEQGLIEATTWAQLQEVKNSLSATRRRTVMGLWDADGRYQWLEAKAQRLKSASDEVEQQQLMEV